MAEQSVALSSPGANLGWPVRFYLWLNQFFPRPPHPFDQGGTKLNYSQFEYETAPKVFALYQGLLPADFMQGKAIIDIACGGGGKTIYLLEQGAAKVAGVDKMPSFVEQAKVFAQAHGQEQGSEFQVADSSALHFPDASFDLAVLNDAMEHVGDPYQTLKEAARVLRPGGLVLINFEPYYHPRGGHVSDVAGIPWDQVFFSEQTRIAAYKHLVQDLPDGAERVAFRIGEREGREAFTYLNHLTIRRFRQHLHSLSGELKIVGWTLLPFQKPILRQLTRLPWLREFFTKNVICILRRF